MRASAAYSRDFVSTSENERGSREPTKAGTSVFVSHVRVLVRREIDAFGSLSFVVFVLRRIVRIARGLARGTNVGQGDTAE